MASVTWLEVGTSIRWVFTWGCQLGTLVLPHFGLAMWLPGLPHTMAAQLKDSKMGSSMCVKVEAAISYDT